MQWCAAGGCGELRRRQLRLCDRHRLLHVHAGGDCERSDCKYLTRRLRGGLDGSAIGLAVGVSTRRVWLCIRVGGRGLQCGRAAGDRR